MKWNTLPKAGGMNDQNYRTIFQMNVLSRVFDTALKWHNSPKDMTADQQKILSWLYKMGLQ
jgi:hypothetical protein